MKICRYLASCCLLLALTAPLSLSATPRDDHDRDDRIYDRHHHDYHRWDDREDRAYRRWEAEEHREHVEWTRLKEKERQRYWNWRHRHRDDDDDDRR